jgi:hypothetical protein
LKNLRNTRRIQNLNQIHHGDTRRCLPAIASATAGVVFSSSIYVEAVPKIEKWFEAKDKQNRTAEYRTRNNEFRRTRKDLAFKIGWFRYWPNHRKAFLFHFPLMREAFFGRTSRPAKCLCGSRDPACPAIALATAEENSMGNGWLNRKLRHSAFLVRYLPAISVEGSIFTRRLCGGFGSCPPSLWRVKFTWILDPSNP